MKVLILGDVSPTKETNPLFHKKDIAGLFHDTGKLFNGNDVNFVNLECALTEKEDCIEKFGPPLKACAETAECLQNIGVNVCGLSNNHIFDYGKKGLNKSGKNKINGVYCDKHKDLDNIIKIVMDALNGICFNDDKQIVCIEAYKLYTQDLPRVEVSFEQIGVYDNQEIG